MPIYKTGKKDKDGRSQYRVTYNYTDASGKYRQRSKLVFGAAEAKFAEAQLKALSTAEPATQLTVQGLYDNYIAAKKNEVRETTLAKIKGTLEFYILPQFKNVKLSKLNVPLLQDWKNQIAKKSLKTQTKKNIYKEFSAMLNFAVRMEHISSNPLKKIGNFKDVYDFNKPEDKIQYYTAEEYKKFISALELNGPIDWAYYTFFSIAFYTGMRKGEINALRWCDIDGEMLSVNRSVAQKVKGKENVFTPPKNASSQRKLQLPKPLVNILKQQKEIQQKTFKRWNEDFLVCGADNPLRDTALSNKNIELSQKAGVKTIRIHDFRHTHATLLINEGINVQEIARRLGHANATITLKVYAHLYPREEERAIKVLNAL